MVGTSDSGNVELGSRPRSVAEPESLVEFEGVWKSFGSFEALQDVDLVVRRGDIITIIGPSGSGKSTLIRCVNGLETIQRGTLRVLGRDVSRLSQRGLTELRSHVGMVFQSFHLYSHLTVLQNIMLAPVRTRKLSRADTKMKAHELLVQLGLPDKGKAFPYQLSGGQQQRVAIARALCMEPELMLFDEPTSALDAEMKKDILDAMIQLAERHMTMIVVTHEIGFAKEVADHVVFMDQGRIVETGLPAELLAAPKMPRTQQFLGKILARSRAVER